MPEGGAPKTAVEAPEVTRSDLGQHLGSGGNKDVYALGDDKAVGILKPGKSEALLDRELAYLDALDDVGVPTVHARKVTVDGQPAIIMDRFEHGSKQVVRLERGKVRIVGDKGSLNSQSVADLQRIRATLIEHKVQVNDLQFLVASDGHVVVADPLDVILGPGPSKNNRRMIDLLIKAARSSS